MNDHESLAQNEERIGLIFMDWLEAAERGESPDRSEWLAANAEFATELEACLADETRLRAIMAPLRDAANAARLPCSPTGSFGDYELLEEIGRGGMGIVYRARQKSLGRFVVLKFCRTGVAGGEADDFRLHHEAAMIAQLDHPHVVPVYEVGEYDGNVYLSMKWIEGGSLDTQLDRFRNDPRAIATLLATVARAVHHAHQRAILHRDLKPSNILLDLAGIPYVTDFGLAKWTDADVSLTDSGALIGTPAYMAPEQATGNRAAIITATDVYGLGAVLYSLLAGRAPFRADSVLETLHQVKERDPEPPRRSNPIAPRDLETICLKCLRKEPARRYESAAALADDLERWLRGEPILARPVGRVERCWRWCRRQPIQAGLAAALFLAVTTGFALVFWQWRTAEANYVAMENFRNQAVAREAEAEESFRVAHQAVKDFTGKPEAGGLLEARGLDPLRRDLLQRAQIYYKRFLERRGQDPGLRRELAEISARLAEIVRETGTPDDARAAYERALALYDTLSRDEPGNASFVLERAKLHTHLGAVHDSLGQRDKALESVKRAQAVLEESLQANPNDASIRAELASIHHNLGVLHLHDNRIEPALASLGLARDAYLKLLDTRSDDPDLQKKLATTFNGIGAALQQNKRPAEALKPLRKAVDLSERLSKRFPEKRMLQHSLAWNLCSLGEGLQICNETKEAMDRLTRARSIMENLVSGNPHVTDYRTTLGNCHAILGRTWMAKKEPELALESYGKAVAMFRNAVNDNPKSADYRTRLVQALLDAAVTQSNLRRIEQAIPVYQEARAVQDQLLGMMNDDLACASRLAGIDHKMGLELAKLRRFEDARTSVLRAVDMQRRTFEKAGPDKPYRRWLADHYGLLAAVNRASGRIPEALEANRKRADLLPKDPQEMYKVAREYALMAKAAKDDPEMQKRCADLAVQAIRSAIGAGFQDVEALRSDPPLNILRSRGDFIELLRGLEKASP